MIVVALIFVVIGVLFAGIGIGVARSSRRFEEQAARARATVTDVRQRAVGRGDGGLVWIPVVRFQTADGHTVDAEAGGGTNLERFEAGQALEVSYDPTNPGDVRVPGSGGGLIQAVFAGSGSCSRCSGCCSSRCRSRSADGLRF